MNNYLYKIIKISFFYNNLRLVMMRIQKNKPKKMNQITSRKKIKLILPNKAKVKNKILLKKK